MKKALVLLFVFVPILVVIAAILWSAGTFAKSVPVDLVEVSSAPLLRSINTNGKVEAEHITEIRAPLAGMCRLIGVREGDRMKKGESILRLEEPSLASQLAAAQADLDAAALDLRDVQRGPAPDELDQAEAESTRARLAIDNARKLLASNEWLLTRGAISRFEVDQSRHSLAEAEQALKAAETRVADLKKKFGDLDRRRAQSRVDAAGARLQYLKETMGRLVVRAPADGTLFQLDVKDGAYLNAGDPIGLFADLTRLHLRAYVDEPDLGQVALGEKVLIRWDAHPLALWEGQVKNLPAQVVTVGTRSVGEVLCRIDNPGGTLLPNINVDVEIQAPAGPSVTSLPRGLVYPEGRREFVWVIADGTAQKRYIETGRSTSAQIEILKGLAIGDKVVDPGDLLITEGMKMRARGK